MTADLPAALRSMAEAYAYEIDRELTLKAADEIDALRKRLEAAEAVCDWADNFDNHNSITQQVHCRKLVDLWRRAAKGCQGRRGVSCIYCGSDNGHTQHCPVPANFVGQTHAQDVPMFASIKEMSPRYWRERAEKAEAQREENYKNYLIGQGRLTAMRSERDSWRERCEIAELKLFQRNSLMTDEEVGKARMLAEKERDECKAKAERYREALKFYAQSLNYPLPMGKISHFNACNDMGDIARKALAQDAETKT